MAEMADNKAGEAPVAPTVPHDRVVSLSLRNDGTPDQNNPEIIGPKDDAVAAAKKQFAEFAVSAEDEQLRKEHNLGADEEGDTSDKNIDALKKAHDKVAEAAEKKAEQVVNALHKG